MSSQSNLSRIRSNKSLKQQLQSKDSFLQRFFHSRQLTFPQFDQELINQKFQSIYKMVENLDISDLKAWILNCYPSSSYFKNILLENKNIDILINNISQRKRNTKNNGKINKIYIGQVSNQQKNGYGFQLTFVEEIENQLSQGQSQKQQSSRDQQINMRFTVYEGFYVNNLKHGKGKYLSTINKNNNPCFYYGRFVNDQTYDQNFALLVWQNNDFYIGKIRQKFQKSQIGMLYISRKNNNNFQRQRQEKINIKIPKTYFSYETVIISQWQAPQLNKKSGKQSWVHLTQAKVIYLNQFYVGQTLLMSQEQNVQKIIKHGKGQLKYLKGDIYQGSFHHDQIHGYGQYVWANKNIYIGQFIEGRKHGSGYWKQVSSGDQYQGQYFQNQRHGDGQYRWINGNNYKGQWKNDMRYGQGTMRWNTGEIYQGEWKDGLQNGQGRMYIFKGKQKIYVRSAQFVNGVQMETLQNQQPLPKFSINTLNQSQARKTRKLSNFTSTRSKQHSESPSNKRSQLSHLPMINQKQIFCVRSTQKSRFHTEQKVNPSLFKRRNQFLPVNKSKQFEFIMSPQRKSLDYKQTQKLPYYKSSDNLVSKTQKIQRNHMQSWVTPSPVNSLSNQKRKKTFFIDLQTDQKSIQKQKETYVRDFNPKEEPTQQRIQYKRVSQILADSLMLPIKWKNIKSKGKNFIIQRKQKKKNFN